MKLPAISLKKPSRHQSKRLNHALVLLGVGLLFIAVTSLLKPFYSTQLWLSDQLFLNETPSPNIVVVGIDDNTLQTYGKWSDWPRRLHAQALDNLALAGARVVGFDILFVDKSSDDPLFAKAIENNGRVVLAMSGYEPLPSAGIDIYDDFLMPVPSLSDASKSTGHVNIVPDRDGKVRRLALVIKDDEDGKIYPAFVLSELYTQFSTALPAEYPLEDGALSLLSRRVRVDSEYQMLVNYATLNSGRTYLSYGDVISGNFDPAVVKNKMVLIGMTATGELDTWGVPTTAGKVPGVYIHAAAMDTILSNRFLTGVGTSVTLLIMGLIVIIVSLLLPVLKIKWGGIILLVLFIAYVAACFIAFDRGYILNMLYPLLLLLVLFVTSIVTMIILEQSDKRFVTDLFGRYVSKQVASQILDLADAGHLQLGGERREVTILFADIRGYTKLSEQMTPEAIVSMLNTFLSIIIDKVLSNGGMVNKFAGDNIMAVWNAPQAQTEHARLAAKAAWESQREIARVQEVDPSLPKVQFGIGLNTGEALAGNVGSSGRSEYTVIGDAVNLSSRICSATPGTEVWMGPETYRQIAQYVKAEALDPQAFKGKAEKVTVYNLKGWNAPDSPPGEK
jgi:adenylate cyclase